MFLHVMRSFAIFIDCGITFLIAHSGNSLEDEFENLARLSSCRDLSYEAVAINQAGDDKTESTAPGTGGIGTDGRTL